jgi:hypothetical protein
MRGARRRQGEADSGRGVMIDDDRIWFKTAEELEKTLDALASLRAPR